MKSENPIVQKFLDGGIDAGGAIAELEHEVELLQRKIDNATTDKVKVECGWTHTTSIIEDEGIWETLCGNTFMFVEGTPQDNKIKFCCYCGRPLQIEAE